MYNIYIYIYIFIYLYLYMYIYIYIYIYIYVSPMIAQGPVQYMRERMESESFGRVVRACIAHTARLKSGLKVT